ncbi:PIN domain-containing protein [Propylenella binzhouense]|uniref:Ribonuclease VapC n=1 Tax=Propylenella binzhouense TaxID=2555902 RepID=A0A964T6Q8_9HYPH|nr:type II toxin-antitoxin system VapC family toxin [Propylenella binzhouense]MYZ49513.1 PIN domain-containing protein [Propylenella binzhouense]
MAGAVLDASAVLALLRSEAGAEPIAELLAESLVCVVNEAEVIGVLVQRGSPPAEALEIVSGLPYRLVDLDRRLARRAGTLWLAGKPHGLSLGDRCCLALAERERLPVYTADRSWARLALDLDVRLVR